MVVLPRTHLVALLSHLLLWRGAAFFLLLWEVLLSPLLLLWSRAVVPSFVALPLWWLLFLLSGGVEPFFF